MISKCKNPLLISLVLIFIYSLAFCQSRYLKITLSEKPHDNVSFPPGTKFQLKNKNNELVFTEKDSVYTYIIKKRHKLIVYPNWKESTDVFDITNGKVELIDTKEFYQTKISKSKSIQSKKYKYDRNKYAKGLELNKTLEVSKINPKSYNAIFEFSNGIIATYTDGEFEAKLNGKNLVITQKYFIYSEFGLIKLSFDPSDGETWWVFEPSKN